MMTSSRVLRPLHVLHAASRSWLLVLAVVVAGCSGSVTPLSEVVFDEAPLVQVSAQAATFRQMPQQDLQLLIAYLAASQRASAENGQPGVAGKPLGVVMQEARAWAQQAQQVIQRAQEVSSALQRVVEAAPVSKQLAPLASPQQQPETQAAGAVMRLSYLVRNRGDRPIVGVLGTMRFVWPDGRQVALLRVQFDGLIEPQGTATLTGHQPVRIGPQASADMQAFAQASLDQLRWEFTPLALKYDNNEVVSVPTL